MRIIILLFLVHFSTSLFAHPLHLTVTNISYYPEENKIEVAAKIFTDDLQNVLLHFFQKKILFSSDSIEPESIVLVNTYISDRLVVLNNNNILPLKQTKSYQLTEDSIWLYYWCKVPQGISEINIKNSILTELFNDQTNLVIYSNGAYEKGMQFDVNKQELRINLNGE